MINDDIDDKKHIITFGTISDEERLDYEQHICSNIFNGRNYGNMCWRCFKPLKVVP